MNDTKFIETLKQKRKAGKEMKHILLHYLDYCNCT